MNNKDCEDVYFYPYCNKECGCVHCLTDEQCKGDFWPYCNKGDCVATPEVKTSSQFECMTNSDCKDTYKNKCNSENKCVVCIANSDCDISSFYSCQEGMCEQDPKMGGLNPNYMFYVDLLANDPDQNIVPIYVNAADPVEIYIVPSIKEYYYFQRNNFEGDEYQQYHQGRLKVFKKVVNVTKGSGMIIFNSNAYERTNALVKIYDWSYFK